MWYEQTFTQLALSTGFAKPTLELVQTFAVLTLCTSNFGDYQREALLIGIAVSTAKALNMHRLGSESSYPKSLSSRPEWSTPAKRELGRRLWWTLVISDW